MEKDVSPAKIPSETDVNSPEKIDVYQLLDVVRQYKSQTDIARQLGVDTRTVRRGEVRQSEPPPYLARAPQYMPPLEPAERTTPADFTFIDLFAGIGGLRQAFEQVGGQCVFTSEWDSYAQKTYVENFRDRHPLNGDITKVAASEVPDHDVLLAGFPCQPFSIAGVSKRNALGRAHGFQDETQGTLFFDVARIIAEKQPRAFVGKRQKPDVTR